MDYTARYGMEFNPFLKNSRDIYIETEEALGKTTALRSFAASLSPANFKVIYTALSTLTVQEFYRQLVVSLGVDPCYHKTDNFHLIQSAINRLAIEKRITPMFINDEANYLNPAILNDLKLLLNFEMDSRDRAVILLAGQPQLNSILSLNAHEALRQRLIMNYSMEGLSKEEGRAYITGKLSGAGCRQTVFDEAKLSSMPQTVSRVS